MARTTVDDEIRRNNHYPPPGPHGPYYGYPYNHYGHPIPPDHYGYGYDNHMYTHRSTPSHKSTLPLRNKSDQERYIDRKTASRSRRKAPRSVL